MNRIKLLALLALISCTAKKISDNSNLIYNKAVEANLIAAQIAERTSNVPNNFYLTGDTIKFEYAVKASIFGADSLKNLYLSIDPSSIIIYQFKNQINKGCVFDVYDSIGTFINKAWIYEDELLSAIDPILFDQSRIDFYKKFITERESKYLHIQTEYSVSRKTIDSLLSARLKVK